MTTPTLSDGVVVLNAYTQSDLAAHLAGEDEEHARRFGWWPKRSTKETVQSAFEQWERHWQTNGPTRAFAVRSSGLLIGGCELRLRDDRIVEASYWTHPAFRGRGLASRALGLATEFAFSALGAERVEVYVEVDNAASRAVAVNAGFREEGALRGGRTVAGARRDMVLLARLATDESAPPARAPPS